MLTVFQIRRVPDPNGGLRVSVSAGTKAFPGLPAVARQPATCA